MPGTDSPPSSPLLIVISGPSAVGKDSVVQRLLEDTEAFTFVVTVNTRSPRPGERPGVDYHFVTREKFLQMVADGEMLEYAPVYDDYQGRAQGGGAPGVSQRARTSSCAWMCRGLPPSGASAPRRC